MSPKTILTYCLFLATPSFAQHKICKEYYCSRQENYKKTLSSVKYYDKDQNIIREVSTSDNITAFDTTDYFYEHALLVKRVRYWGIEPQPQSVDAVLNYIKKHPESLGHSLHHIVRQRASDTEMTKYYYNQRGLLIKKEHATFSSGGVALRSWHGHLLTHYVYGDNGKLVEANGDLFDEMARFGSMYRASAEKYFYNAKNELVTDSIVSYTGTRFDGEISNYSYTPDGYEIRKEKYGREEPYYYLLTFILNKEGKLLEEVEYYAKSPGSKLEDLQAEGGRKKVYEYDGSGRLIKVAKFYRGDLEPDSIIYYEYE